MSGILAILTLPFTASAQPWYLNKTQPNGQDWNTLTDWSANSDGTGATPTQITAEDTFYTNGRILRTTTSNGTISFGGQALVINSGALWLKAQRAEVANIKVTTSGGIIQANYGGTTSATAMVQTLAVNDMEVYGEVWLSSTYSAPNVFTLALEVQKLSGNGTLRVLGGSSSGVVTLSINDGSEFDGIIRHSIGQLAFDNDFSLANASLVIDSGTFINLNYSVIFSSLTIAGTTLDAGTYSYDYLSNQYAGIFINGNENGYITVVPEAKHFALFGAGAALLVLFMRKRNR